MIGTKKARPAWDEPVPVVPPKFPDGDRGARCRVRPSGEGLYPRSVNGGFRPSLLAALVGRGKQRPYELMLSVGGSGVIFGRLLRVPLPPFRDSLNGRCWRTRLRYRLWCDMRLFV